MDNILFLHNDLKNKTYAHGAYEAFNISDPKPRNIHKASVRDRLLHHAIYRILYPYFDKRFIHDSYSCRLNKGTHRAMERFKRFARKASANSKRTCWVLKCDIRKFFASIDHQTLRAILKRHIQDEDTLWLLGRVIESFESDQGGTFAQGSTLVHRNTSFQPVFANQGLTSSKRGLPLGNLTSQLLVNIYMNEFDQWMKHRMKAEYYIRYADDFVILSNDKDELVELLPKIGAFLEEELKLTLHPDKVFIKTLASGVDFLGWVHFPDHRVIRTATKRRMMRNVRLQQGDPVTVQSYLGMLQHGNAFRISNEVQEISKI